MRLLSSLLSLWQLSHRNDSFCASLFWHICSYLICGLCIDIKHSHPQGKLSFCSFPPSSRRLVVRLRLFWSELFSVVPPPKKVTKYRQTLPLSLPCFPNSFRVKVPLNTLVRNIRPRPAQAESCWKTHQQKRRFCERRIWDFCIIVAKMFIKSSGLGFRSVVIAITRVNSARLL